MIENQIKIMIINNNLLSALTCIQKTVYLHHNIAR